MKRSFRWQITLLFTLILAGILSLCYGCNILLMEHFYTIQKQKVIIEAYESLNENAASGKLTTGEYQEELGQESSKDNISTLVISSENEVIVYSSRDKDRILRQLWNYIFEREELQDEVILEQTDQYTLRRCRDKIMNNEYLSMVGTLDSGDYFMISTPMESIRESAHISNIFFLYISFLGIIFGAVLIFMSSRFVTKPILELAEISKKMTALDFDAKFETKSKNEIGVLGDHMNQLSETLEQTISELKTANNELQRDIEKKEKLNKERMEFLSNVSHELKTPLALIQGYAEGLSECINDDEESRNFYCDVIMDEADKMNKMVKRLLTLDELESGDEVISMERFDVAELIDNIINSTSLLAKQAEAKVSFYHEGPVYIWADEFKIEEVITNYISNAYHHLDGDNSIDIKITQNDQLTRVSVFNSGIPIPVEDLEHIWDKFYKVDKAHTREYGGSGIGLSIVKAIMDSMNGSYGVVNYANGVEFWFAL